MKLDVCSITQGTERYYSFMSVNYGIIADCDLGTEHLRYLTFIENDFYIIYKNEMNVFLYIFSSNA